MKTAEIKRRWLEFFEKKNHAVVPSASLISQDPNLMFTVAGMVPFIPYMTGVLPAPFPRATSVQKCVRTLDIEEVGKTTRHGTFFQMNGNFSFGDYFKKEAIAFAWELLTSSVDKGGYGFDPNRLWVTVYKDDDESIGYWLEQSSVPRERIQKRGMKDNYWSTGQRGPAGPCSEIYYDRGPEYGIEGGPEADENRYIEIWNLVFMQYERGDGGAKEDFEILGELPKKNIDTGMGLERVAFLLQGVENIYEIDQVRPLIDIASELSGKQYGANETDDVRMRVIADHIRSALMLMSDGVTPSNEGRGYVLRRLLRRSVRALRLLGIEGVAFERLFTASKDAMVEAYPELEETFSRVLRAAIAEESGFRKTLDSGSQVLAEELAKAETKFLGYESLTAEAKVIGLIHDGQSVEELVEGQIGEVILDRTSLYAESGGQIADAGQILADGLILEVLDVQKPVKGLFSHQVRVVQGSVAKMDSVLASVYHDWRVGACQAHSATHVVHAALRQVLGPNALQSGSYNRPGYMRLDFAWGESLSDATKSEIEEVSNLAIRADLAVSAQFMTLPQAKEWGAIALFGETYDEQVRVVQVGGPWSRELCGGTHVSRTAQIGLVSVTGESSVGSGVRRIEAEVGIDALRNLLQERAIVRRISAGLKAPVAELEARITESLDGLKALEKELSELRFRAAKDKLASLYASTADIAGKKVLASQLDGIDSAETLRQLALTAKDSLGSSSVILLGSKIEDKPVVMIAVGKDAVAAGISAGTLAKKAAEILGGGGGGKADFAQGGGTDASKLSESIQAARGLIS